MKTATASQQTNPFPGLRPFREDEEQLFFGRENQVDAMVNKLAGTHFLAVIGTSGSGKSSLVNCGLRPALRQGLMARAGTAWRMAQFRPGNDPIGAMARALAQDGVLFREHAAAGLTLAEIIETSLRMSRLGLIDIYEQAGLDTGVNLLVVVDQFEELFRYRQLEAAGRGSKQGISEQAAALVNLLLEVKEQATCPIYVVLTMRSDFLGECTQLTGLAEAINAGQYLVPRMTRDERRAAIEGPVRVGGAEITPVLLTRLVNDVGDNPDQLSILQHALNRTWARWQNQEGSKGPLDLPHYEAIGTMSHALDHHAERAYAELSGARQQQIGEKLFKALTDKATDPRGVRRPTTLGTLCALADATAAEVTDVIAVFRKPSRSFLMPPAGDMLTAETVIDISHESLMRVWQRLDKWADEEARSAQTYRRLADTAALHAAGEASLWRDPDLQLALDWDAKSQPNETWASRYHRGFAAAMRFLAESSEARAAERAEREQQRRRALEAEREKAEAQARYARRMRAAALSSGALAVVALVVGVMAYRAKQEAQEQATMAQTAQARFIANLARQHRAAGDSATAGLLALEALPDPAAGITRPYVPEVELQLDGAWHALRERLILNGHEDGLTNAAFSPDGTRIVTASRDKTARLWDAATGRPIGAPFEGHENTVRSATFSPDGKRIVTASQDTTARLWDADTGKPIGEPLKGHENSVWAAAFSPDGKRIVTASDDKTARLWDAETGKPIGGPLKGHTDHVRRAAFSPDGKLIVTASDDKTVRLWNTDTGQPIGEPLKGHEKRVWSAAFSPDGKRIVTASDDYTARMWDADTGKPIGEPLKGHTDNVYSAAFSPDGKRIVTTSDDKTVRLWDAATGKQIDKPLKGHEDRVWSAAFSADNKQILTASLDRTARLWDVEIGQPLAGHEDEVNSAVFSPDGTRIVTASDDKTARLWDANTGKQIGEPLRGHADFVWRAAFSADGKRIVTVSRDRTAQLWDAQTGERLGEPLSGHEDVVRSAGFSPDGKRVVTASADKTARLWDAATGAQLGEPLKGHTDFLWSAAFSPDGKRIVTASSDRTARLWDAMTHKQIGEPLKAHNQAVRNATFSPDGRRILTASDDKTARLWDADSGKPLGLPLTGHDNPVTSAAFSPDGKRIVTVADPTARLWDADTGRPIGELTDVTSAAFSPDGKRIATASGNNARLWGNSFADRQELMRQAKAAVPRCLNASQRKESFLQPEPPYWCIELEKWPYQTAAWKQWLSSHRAGKKPALPAAD